MKTLYFEFQTKYQEESKVDKFTDVVPQVDVRYIATETEETMEFQGYQSYEDATNKEKRKSINALVVKIRYHEKNVKRNLQDDTNVMVLPSPH